MNNDIMHSGRHLRISTIALLLLSAHVLGAQATGIIPSLTSGAAAFTSGLWEEAGKTIANQRYDRRFSWGKAMVVPNYGVIIDLESEKPFVQWDGQMFTVQGVSALDDGQLEILLGDETTSGTRAFKVLRFAVQVGDTARIDFIRADGSTFGALLYERRYGPAVK